MDDSLDPSNGIVYSAATNSEDATSTEAEYYDDSEEEQNVLEVNNNFRPTKRVRNVHLHKVTLAKKAVEEGEERVTKKAKKIISAKKFEPQFVCDRKCKKKCADKIDVGHQRRIFEIYWKLSNWTQKTLLLRKFVRKTPVKKSKSELNPVIPMKNRQFNNTYTFTDENNTHHEVCLDFFLKCLCIPKSRVYKALNSEGNNPSCVERRGKNSSKNKTSDEDEAAVVQFINLFPRYESHYGRSRSQRQYLPPNLNIARLYKEYKRSREIRRKEPVSDHIFRRIFKTRFNLSFKRRHSDTCKTCDTLNIEESCAQENQREIKARREAHHGTVKRVNEEFARDIQLAKETTDTIVITFDLQKTLETPSLTTSIAFYKRQLWTYNLCVYDEVGQQAYMYIWSEDVASRGGQEIGSCVREHLKHHTNGNIKKIIAYSDACGGQNRNIKMSLLLKQVQKMSGVETIIQKFLVSGHTYNRCDACFSDIEREKKLHETVSTPNHWIEIIRNCRTKKKFIVKKMEMEDFVSTSDLEKKITNRKVDVMKKKVNWLTARSIEYQIGKPYSIFLTNDDGVKQEIDIQKRKVKENIFESDVFPLLFPTGHVISKEKYDDLQVLKGQLMPQDRRFYEGLRYAGENVPDFGLASGDDDDDLENCRA